MRRTRKRRRRREEEGGGRRSDGSERSRARELEEPRPKLGAPH